jgi:adenosylcobinamide-phosphate synthase
MSPRHDPEMQCTAAEAAWELPLAMVAGAIADTLLGDPHRFHPVAGFARLALASEKQLWRPSRRRGATYAVALVGFCAAGVALTEHGLRSSRALRGLWRAVVVWTVLGGASLRHEAAQVGAALERGDIDEARRRAPALVGRDPTGLDAAELARATVESVAENTSDAVVGSLLWCAVAGSPGAAAHRAVNTLDAMVGHRSERYREFGWASARLDDAANWLPARVTAGLTILIAPVAGTTVLESARVVRRDGAAHPSPNAGRVEAAFAGALAVRLGGVNKYGTQVVHRPAMGSGNPPSTADIARAVALSRTVARTALVLCAGLAWALRR